MINRTSKINILVDAHIFDHSFQGTATYIQGLYSALVNFEDIRITFCSHDIEKLTSLFPDPRFNFVQLTSSSRLKRLLYEYPRIIKEGNYDYAHFQYVVPFVKGCKFINTIHDLLFLDFKQYFPWSYRISRQLLFKYSADRSDIILTVSEYSKRKVAERFNINPSLIHVTPNAVNPVAKSTVDIRGKYKIRKFLLYVSRFEPRKNHIGLLRAYLTLELNKRGYDLVFIGSKKEEIELNAFNEVKSLINDAVKPHIHFLEGLDYESLYAFYQQASCFVFPSLAEGFGIPPIEAAINGCKVLSSNQTAMSDFDFFKFTFDPNNQQDFENKLNGILNDETYPFDLIRNEVLNRYNWAGISEKLHMILVEDYKKV